jgi:hypothetical protein
MRWIALFLLVFVSGCASQRYRVTVTRVNGEPAVSLEIEERVNNEYASYIRVQ